MRYFFLLAAAIFFYRLAEIDSLVQIELTAHDKEGYEVLAASPVISCEIEGPAHLVGTDGGNLLDRYTFSYQVHINCVVDIFFIPPII